MRRALLALALLLAAAPLAAAWPATDGFGYQAVSVTPAVTDISGSGTLIQASDWTGTPDDGWVQVNLPFNFDFYGSAFSKFYLRPNGYLQFSPPDTVYDPFTCPLNSLGQKAVVAAFWMDLDLTSSGTVAWQVLGSAPNRQAVVQFTAVPPHQGGGVATFQMVLGEDASITFNYIDTVTLGSGSSALAGIASFYDCPNRDSLTLACDQPVLTDGLSLLLSYPAQPPDCGTPTDSPTPTLTATRTPSITRTFTASPSASVTSTFSATLTDSPTPTASPSATDSPTPTASGTISPSFTASPSYSDSPTPTPSFSASPSATPSATPTASPTDSPTDSPTATPSATPSITPTASPTATPSASPTATASATPSSTTSPTASVTPTASPTASPTFTATLTATPTRSFTASPSVTPTFTSTATLFPPPPRPGCLVLGQADLSTAASRPPAANSLSGPTGIAWDTRVTPYKVYIADTLNHRVLLWQDAGALAAGQPADGVIGQADFSAALANRGGAAGANTLNAPKGLAVDPQNGDLWVADSGNHRVLRFHAPFPVSGAAAVAVLGQGGSYTSAVPSLGGVSALSLNSPSALSCDPFGDLAVADSGDNRVLRFGVPVASGAAADTVWGQPSFNGAAADHGAAVDATTLSGPLGVLLGSDALWVADTGNHRVLGFSLAPPFTGAAILVLGQAGFTTSLPNQGYGLTNETRLDAPQGLAYDAAKRVLVADTGNHRVLGFEPPYPNSAAQVWGQNANIGSRQPGCNSDAFNAPQALASAGGSLVVADTGNQRAVFYGCGSVVQVATATPTFTLSPSFSPSATLTLTVTLTLTPSPSFTAGPSLTPSPSFTMSPSFTPSPTLTLTATASLTPTLTATPSITATYSASPTATRSSTAAPTLTPAPVASGQVLAWPNPIDRQAGGVNLAVPPQAGAVALDLYDRLGQKVAHLELSAAQGVLGYGRWDLHNTQGALVAPGLYYIRAQGDKRTWFGRVTVR